MLPFEPLNPPKVGQGPAPHLSGSTTRGCENSRGTSFFWSDTGKSHPAEKPSSTLLISNLPQYDYPLVKIEYCKIHKDVNQKLVQILSEPIKIKHTRLDEIVLLTNTKIQIEEERQHGDQVGSL
jgi:hypothetical protein